MFPRVKTPAAYVRVPCYPPARFSNFVKDFLAGWYHWTRKESKHVYVWFFDASLFFWARVPGGGHHPNPGFNNCAHGSHGVFAFYLFSLFYFICWRRGHTNPNPNSSHESLIKNFSTIFIDLDLIIYRATKIAFYSFTTCTIFKLHIIYTIYNTI